MYSTREGSQNREGMTILQVSCGLEASFKRYGEHMRTGDKHRQLKQAKNADKLEPKGK